MKQKELESAQVWSPEANSGLYRAEYGERSMLSQRQHQLLKVMHVLQNIAHTHNIAVVITNQIQTSPDDLRSNSDIAVGGMLLLTLVHFGFDYAVQTRIEWGLRWCLVHVIPKMTSTLQ